MPLTVSADLRADDDCAAGSERLELQIAVTTPVT
jgi:hypothetical protein